MSFFDRLKILCDNSGIPISQLGSIIPNSNISMAAISKWKTGSIPRVSNVKPIADYFHVTVGWLMNGDEEENYNNCSNNNINGSGNVIGNGNTILTLSAQENALLDLFRSLDVIGQAKVLTYAAEQKKTGNNPDQL